MSTVVIQEFLAELGFKVNKDGEQLFQESLSAARATALGLGAALTAVGAAVVATANAYSRMGYEARNAQTSVGSMNALGYAIQKVGGSAEGVRSSLMGISNFIRFGGPGAENAIRNMGIATRDANGHLRNTADILTDFFEHARKVPQYVAAAQAQLLGIDTNTLIAGESDPQMLRHGEEEYQDIYRRLGIDQQKAAAESQQLMNQLNYMRAAGQALIEKVTLSIIHAFGWKDLKDLTNFILDHSDQIAASIKHIIDVAGSLLHSLINASKSINSLVEGTIGWKNALIAVFAIFTVNKFAPLIRLMGTFVGLLLKASRVTLPAVGAIAKAIKTAAGVAPAVEEAATEAAAPAAAVATKAAATAAAATAATATAAPAAAAADASSAIPAAASVGESAAAAAIPTAPAAVAGETAVGAAGTTAISGAALPAIIGAVMAAGSTYVGYKGVSLVHKMWDNAHAAAPKLQNDREQMAMKFWESVGLKDYQAAGIVGNTAQESRVDPTVIGDGGAAHGIGQWHEDRARQIYKDFSIDVSHASLPQQLKAMYLEATQGDDPQAKKAWKLVQEAKNAAEAAHVWRKYYERPADKFNQEDSIRTAHADRILNTYGAVSHSPSQTNHITVTTQSPEPQKVADVTKKAISEQWAGMSMSNFPRRHGLLGAS